MIEPATPSAGLGVLHMFCRATPSFDRQAAVDAVHRAEATGDQVIAVAILGHKADVALMCLSDDLWRLRRLQTRVQGAGLDLVDSYMSLTEVSEYAQGIPEEMRDARLRPNLPPQGKPAWCFYPMSKSRVAGANWFSLPFAEREQLMHEHGTSGRAFAGRVLQVVTGSTGIDNYEWGVTLFAARPDDLKEVVYTMRFDRASAGYGVFGPFYAGMVASIEEVLSEVGPADEGER